MFGPLKTNEEKKNKGFVICHFTTKVLANRIKNLLNTFKDLKASEALLSFMNIITHACGYIKFLENREIR